MAVSFKKFLADSVALTLQNAGQIAKELHSDALKGTKEWELINSKDPAFGKKMLIAWEGDVRDYEKQRYGDPLFVKMIQPASVEKLSSIKVDAAIKSALQKLDMLFYKAMPKNAKQTAKTKDVWWHERHVREYIETHVEEYLELREEIESILNESSSV